MNDQHINWYNCGPTIYNRSHLGHARTFIIFDAMRKYYETKYQVTYAMNITDIDDKIVNKIIMNKMINIIHQIENDYDCKLDNIKTFDDIKTWLLTEQKYININKNNLKPSYEEYKEFIMTMETLFWNDMDRIGVMRPDFVVRVSDCIPSIIDYIQKIIDNKYAYVSNGSVYFDSKRFINAGYTFTPSYINLENSKSIKSNHNKDKQSHHDFALWKTEKDLDIGFDSPWGKGRPGWHVECSTMIYNIFNDKLDIHSGGIDLSFPHHNNEAIQTIAYFDEHKGVPTQYHYTGHLHIKSDKMSQSKGNMITIDEFLTIYGTARQLRLLFFSHNWKTVMDFTFSDLDETKNIDTMFNAYFRYIDNVKRNKQFNINKQSYDDDDICYINKLSHYKNQLHNALDDDFDTKLVILTIRDMIHDTYIYTDTFNNNYSGVLVLRYSNVIQKYMDILNLDYKIDINNEITHIEHYIETIIDIRDDIRNTVKKIQDIELKKILFNITDDIRDNKLRKLNICLEDQKNQKIKWNFSQMEK